MRSSVRLRRGGLGGLLALNGALLLALGFVTFGAPAVAQGYRAKGMYHAVPAKIPGRESAVLFIVDEVNQQMLALGFDPNARTVHVVGGRDLAVDAAQYGRSRN